MGKAVFFLQTPVPVSEVNATNELSGTLGWNVTFRPCENRGSFVIEQLAGRFTWPGPLLLSARAIGPLTGPPEVVHNT